MTDDFPTDDHERAHGAFADRFVIGVDEAGRGPLAGPVVAAAVRLDFRRLPSGINDSKKLKPEARARLCEEITAAALCGVGEASVEEIDRINILHASMLAMQRAVEALHATHRCTTHVALIDGNRAPALTCKTVTLIGGDARSLSIAAASIVAKVARDRRMAELHEEFPHYGWASNAGYGTAAHQAGLLTHGVTIHHRRSFAPIRLLLEQAA